MDGFQESKWFVYVNDHHEGPFSLHQLQTKLQSGEFQRTQYVWREGMNDWQIMTAVREMDSIISAFEEVKPPEKKGPKLELRAEAEPVFDLSIDLTHDKAPEKALFAQEKHLEVAEPIAEDLSIEAPEPVASDLQTLHPEALAQESFISEPAPKSKSTGLMKAFLSLALIGGAAYGYASGALDPVFKNPLVASSLSSLGDLTSPALNIAAKWLPPLKNWISSIPALPGVSEEELLELRKNSKNIALPDLALAANRVDPSAPIFYVSSGVPDGTKLEITLLGVPVSLLGQTELLVKSTIEVKNRLARFENLRQEDGRPLAQGDYAVIVTEADLETQPESVKGLMAKLPTKALPLPEGAGISPDKKLFIRKDYFLGGVKDEVYAQRLSEFHGRLRDKSAEELNVLTRTMDSLESQLTATTSEHSKIFGVKRSKKLEAAWSAFHHKWTSLQTEIDTSSSGWADAIARKEFFHWPLYELARSSAEKISQLHVLQHSGFSIQPEDSDSYEDQLGEKQRVARETLDLLRSKVEESKKLNESGDGLPQRSSWTPAPALPEGHPPVESKN